MKRFIKRNDSFVCEVCGYHNSPASVTCRNHCCQCLYSKHVDKNPGDRAEQCGGIMKPIDVEILGGELTSIVFKCQKCGFIRKNKIASDDNREKLFEIVENRNN